MYIKSVTIDGFKSYAQRTEINGFDPLFNAITGLNGSGKSNILDAICFLLGITNLCHVRASSLQELVYKNGQAGITKATVAIVFDNSDKNQSPLGYEQYEEITVTRQVVIGGRNKYLINGNNANNTRVQDLFRSVQLNVNNPHFLIMQGRITKVLNMKPPEILSMIEEAAGTRLYESKKELAQKTIEKKDARLKEIDTILNEEITPTLARLKEERSSYLEYQKVLRELEHLNKLYIAYQFVCAEETSSKCAEDLVQMQESVNKLQARQTEITQEVEAMENEIKELERKRDEEAGGVMEKLESELAELQKQDAKALSTLTNKKDACKAENKKLTTLKKQHTNDENSLKAKKKENEKIQKTFVQLEEHHKTDDEALQAAQKHYHAITAGLSSNTDGDAASLNDQLMTAKKEVSDCETQKKQAQMQLKHAQADIKKKQADLKKTEASYKKDSHAYEQVKVNMEKLKAELDKLSYEEGREEKLLEERLELMHEVRQLRDTVDTQQARFPQLNFDYRDPEKNFDRSKVHGLVARLIAVKDVKTATALEVAAGGKLYNVVVDTEVTGKKLLQKGDLRRRYTIIPLNKIAANTINPQTVHCAEQLVGKANVKTALSLVGYEDEVSAAMAFVFGNAFVCNNMDNAKKVTFHQNVMKKCVTLDGDSFDPAGLLTGGARAQTASVLEKLTELNTAQQELHEQEKRLEKIEAELNSIRKVAHQWRQLNQQYELKQQEVQMLEERLKQSTHHQQLEEIQQLEESIEADQKILAEAQERGAAAGKKAAEIENKLKNAKQEREKELKAAEKAMKDAKTKLENSRKEMKAREEEAVTLKLEVEDIEKEIAKCEEEMKVVEEAIKNIEEEVAALATSQAETKSSVKEAQQKVNEQKDLLKSCNKDIAAKISQQKALHKEASAAQLQIQDTDHKISKSNKDAKDAAKQVEALLQKYSWISEEKKYFGQPNTAYDFKANNPKEAGRRMEKLTETKEKLAKSVNMRAMSMLGKAEEQYNDLVRKRNVVLNDKAKIAAVIAELDAKKNEALKKAHKQVNQDFGSIFSTLLPGTQAKLVAPDGGSILDGLEVKVAFGNVWKESLNELSGGQRSLVALSLILSLLLFKPAPLYILDEVDAALDLSHTQNIGQMLRTHFTSSQFIVVSLKDGMFNNANVLFKTRFVDGVSCVTRYAQQQSRQPLSSSNNANIQRKDKSKKNKRARADDSTEA